MFKCSDLTGDKCYVYRGLQSIYALTHKAKSSPKLNNSLWSGADLGPEHSVHQWPKPQTRQ